MSKQSEIFLILEDQHLQLEMAKDMRKVDFLLALQGEQYREGLLRVVSGKFLYHNNHIFW